MLKQGQIWGGASPFSRIRPPHQPKDLNFGILFAFIFDDQPITDKFSKKFAKRHFDLFFFLQKVARRAGTFDEIASL